jgi:lipopolysaccharide biosynthesis protein
MNTEQQTKHCTDHWAIKTLIAVEMWFFPSVAWFQHRCKMEEGTDERNDNLQTQSEIPTRALLGPHHSCTADGPSSYLEVFQITHGTTFWQRQRVIAIYLRWRKLQLTCSSCNPSTSQNLDLPRTVHIQVAEHCLSQLYPITQYKKPRIVVHLKSTLPHPALFNPYTYTMQTTS